AERRSREGAGQQGADERGRGAADPPSHGPFHAAAHAPIVVTTDPSPNCGCNLSRDGRTLSTSTGLDRCTRPNAGERAQHLMPVPRGGARVSPGRRAAGRPLAVSSTEAVRVP